MKLITLILLLALNSILYCQERTFEEMPIEFGINTNEPIFESIPETKKSNYINQLFFDYNLTSIKDLSCWLIESNFDLVESAFNEYLNSIPIGEKIYYRSNGYIKREEGPSGEITYLSSISKKKLVVTYHISKYSSQSFITEIQIDNGDKKLIVPQLHHDLNVAEIMIHRTNDNKENLDTLINTLKHISILIDSCLSLDSGYFTKKFGKNYQSNILGNISWIHALKGNGTECLNYGKRGLELYPKNNWLYSNLAIGNILNGNTQAAKDIYKIYSYYRHPNIEKSEPLKFTFLKDLKNIRLDNNQSEIDEIIEYVENLTQLESWKDSGCLIDSSLEYKGFIDSSYVYSSTEESLIDLNDKYTLKIFPGVQKASPELVYTKTLIKELGEYSEIPKLRDFRIFNYNEGNSWKATNLKGDLSCTGGYIITDKVYIFSFTSTNELDNHFEIILEELNKFKL